MGRCDGMEPPNTSGGGASRPYCPKTTFASQYDTVCCGVPLGWVVVGLCVWQRCASLHITCTHGRARTWRRRRRARGLLPIPISLVIPLCLCPRRTLRVVFVFWCVVWGWRVACFGGKHLKPVHTCLPRHLGGSLSSRLVRWPAPSPARRRCQTSPEPKGRLLPSHVVPRATRAPIVARARPALHAHVARMTCLSQCLQHDPATVSYTHLTLPTTPYV